MTPIACICPGPMPSPRPFPVSYTHLDVYKRQLCGVLWEEKSEEMAKKSLRNAIYTLRKVFGKDFLLSPSHDMVRLGGDYQLDTDLAYLNQSAPEGPPDIPGLIGFYAHDFLSGFQLRRAGAFYEWLYYKQSHYRSVYLKLLEKAAQQAKACLLYTSSCMPNMLNSARASNE